MKNEKLEALGRTLMTEVRDPSILDLEMVLDGRMKGDTAKRIRAALARLRPEDLELVSAVVPELVDRVVHGFLAVIDESEELELRYGTGVDTIDASRVSDGLAGELYSHAGWIAKYSKYPGPASNYERES